MKNLCVLTLNDPGIISTVIDSDWPIGDASKGGDITVTFCPDLKKIDL